MEDSLKKENGFVNIFKSVYAVFMILVLHVFLIALLGCVVLFFRGVINYLMWIFVGGLGLIFAVMYAFYKKIKADKNTINEILNSSNFKGKSVEISLLGGFASVKVNNSASNQDADINYLDSSQSNQYNQSKMALLEDPAAIKIRKLKELVSLLQNNFITIEEYNQTKQQIFES